MEYRAALTYEARDGVTYEQQIEEIQDRYLDEVQTWGPIVGLFDGRVQVLVSFECEDVLGALDILRTRMPHGEPMPVDIHLEIAV